MPNLFYDGKIIAHVLLRSDFDVLQTEVAMPANKHLDR